MNNLFKKSIKEYQKTQDLSHEIQKLSNKIRTDSKKAIALLRRDNARESKETIDLAKEFFREINQKTKKNRELMNQGFYKEAVEEYIEAVAYYNFLTESKIKIPNFIEVVPEEIISGVCDFTGELVRRAITTASAENLAGLFQYKKAIENVAEELTKIGFKGKLRQKYDEVERNLGRMENILYDIKLKKIK